MKKYFALINILILVGCSPVKDFTSFSKYLYKVQKSKKECGSYPKITYKQRNKLIKEVDFIDYKHDTIYLLEAYYMETSTFYEAIWTKKGKIEYKFQANNIEYKKENNYFIKRLYPLIENWDIPAIKAEDANSNILGGGMMLGARVVIKDGKIIAQCISFNEFFDIQKDN